MPSTGRSVPPFTLSIRSPLTVRSSCRVSPLPSKWSVTPFSSTHSVPYSMTSSWSFTNSHVASSRMRSHRFSP